MTTTKTPGRLLLPISERRQPNKHLGTADRARQRESSILLPKNGATAMVRDPLRVRPRLAAYLRLSLGTDASVSMARQRETLEAYIVALGGQYDPSRDCFEDYDVSAKGTMYRPAAEELLSRIQNEEYDGIVCWEFARFMRTVRESHIASALMRDHATELYSFEEKGLTLYGPGRLMLEFAAEQSEKELQRISARTTAAWEFMAKHGHHRAMAPFGLRKFEAPSTIRGRTAPLHHLTPDDEPRDYLTGRSPAEVIREAAHRVVDGDSMRSITAGWNRDGIRTMTGSLWSMSTLSLQLRNPQLAGFATFRGEIVLGDDGAPLRPHEQLLSEGLWEDLQAELATRGKGRRRARNQSLLRGLIRCGLCGAAMTRTGDPITGAYACSRRAQSGTGCKGNASKASKTEAFVVEAALAVLADPQLREAERNTVTAARLAQEGEQEEAAARLRNALDRLDRGRALGEYDDDDGQRRYAKLKADFVQELLTLEAGRPRRVRRTAPVLVADTGEGLAAAFDKLPKMRQTSVLANIIERVDVLAWTGKHGDPWSSDRIRIVWRSQA